MYKPAIIGPMPVIDPAATLDVFNSTATVDTLGTQLTVCLDTPNLGSKTEAYAGRVWNNTASAAAAGDRISFGVCLAPMNTFTDMNIATYLDINISVNTIDVNGTNIISPFIGYIDTAGANIGTGWNANNAVGNYCRPGDGGTQVYDNSLHFNSQVLLKSITSAELSLDKFMCVGFSVIAPAAGTFAKTEYNITARYANSSVSTYGIV